MSVIDTTLPKWSRLVVSGKNVTPDQASEIILRTSILYFSTNDKDWKHELDEAIDLFLKNSEHFLNDNKQDRVEKLLGLLDVYYLQNFQIASCHIGGPRGWCSWDGTIGCDGYNIGKDPDVESVCEEWKQIASAWPFLTLRCQLWNNEYGVCENACPVIEFVVADGNVTVIEPVETIEYDYKESSFPKVLLPYGERGCSLDRFKRAMELSQQTIVLAKQ